MRGGHRAVLTPTDKRPRRDEVGVRKALLVFLFEVTVFPWQHFKGSAAIRRTMITRNVALAIVIPILALVAGSVVGALAALAFFGGMLTFLVLAHRRIEARRRAQREQRVARTRARLTQP